MPALPYPCSCLEANKRGTLISEDELEGLDTGDKLKRLLRFNVSGVSDTDPSLTSIDK